MLLRSKVTKDFLKTVATIVLAGGQGTRLFPLTAQRCKPAVAFGGRYRLIDIPLSNSLNARINQIYVISQYFASDLHQHILSTYKLDMFRDGRLELLTPQETLGGKSWFKGTADAVRQNLEYILKTPSEYFLILSGDQLYNMDLLDMLNLAEKTQADLVIASLPVEEPEARRMGVMRTAADGRILSFYEKPQDPAILKQYQLPSKKYLASMGIYIFKRDVLISLLKEPGDDFGRHLIPKAIEKDNCFAYTYNGYWEDIGTVASYFTANLLLTEGKGIDLYHNENKIYSHPYNIPGSRIHNTRITNSIISQGAIIDAAEITRSVIGVRCCIKKGTIIEDSIVNGHRNYHPLLEKVAPKDQYYSIGEDCVIKRAIIDEEVRIGNRVQLVNKSNIQNLDSDGVYIRDGIIVVTSGTELPDDYTL